MRIFLEERICIMRKKIFAFLLCLLFAVLALWGCTEEELNSYIGYLSEETESSSEIQTADSSNLSDRAKAAESYVQESKTYTAPEDVAAYIHLYKKLPKNFISKKDAQNLGWDSKEGNLQDVAPGKSIGGDRFGNYEGLLPSETKYTECDINYTGGYRGAERIIFGQNGSVYYTNDHYKTFEQIY